MPSESVATPAGNTVETLLREKYEPIAIVGIGLRFPGGSESLDEFDEFLRAGRSGIRALPEDRWDASVFTPASADEKGKIHTAGGGFLDRIDLFDAPFFNISPKEAQYIDPQQRLVLETAWHALENASIDPTPLRRGNGGVYVGASSIDYALEIDGLPYEELDGHLASGITMFPLSGRLSYFLGWRGPSVSVDTACSSSLSALHMAVQGLRQGECDIALCGGVNALHHPRIMVMFSHGQMLAADGQCKTFDDAADGYTRAEGCGMLVLKRLSDAERDGDSVLALVRGTAIGQDGDSAGLTVPNGPAQELVIRRALGAARLAPGDIQYVEAHGTGTPVGDPIELGAINDVFAESHTRENPLMVGSVKTNLGHMEPASGVVGVIKTVLQLRSGTIYPHLNLTTPSARIPWDTYPVRVPTECTPWPGDDTRRAVVNSFGFAGTISAVVLEEAPHRAPTGGGEDAAGEQGTDVERPSAVFTVSGKNAAALRRQVERYQEFLADDPDIDIERLCYTANLGRAHFSHRLSGVVKDLGGLSGLLKAQLAKDEPPSAGKTRRVAFLFSGQGTQYSGMGAALYERFPVFRESVDTCDRMFAEYLDISVRDLLLGTADDATLIDRTEYTQPALFTLEYGLAKLWMSWGMRPNVLIGHSIGEVVAAAVAGLFSLPDAVKLVAVRARLMQSVRTAGGMAAVHAPADEVEPLLEESPELAMAAVNAPGQCVVSGAQEPLDKLVGRLRERGLRVEPLSVSHAFHSPLMHEVFDEFRAALDGISFNEPSLPLVSNVTGKVAAFREIGTPEYWVRHIGEPVLFMEGVRAIEKRGRHAFVELGPSAALTALAKQCLTDEHHWAASLRRRGQGTDAILHGLADLYTAGISVDWPGVHAGRELPRVTLPEYAFQRRRYWLPLDGAGGPAGGVARQGPATHPLLGQESSEDRDGGPGLPTGHDTADAPEWTREFSAVLAPGSPAWSADHTDPEGNALLPAAAYVELLLAAQDAVYGHTQGVIRDLRLDHPLTLPEDAAVEVRTRLRGRPGGGADVEVVSGPTTDEVRHATAVLDDGAPGGGPVTGLDALAGAPGEAAERAGQDDVYTDLASVGRVYGEAFRLLTGVTRHPGGVLTATLSARRAHPVEQLPVEVLESALQATAALDEDSPAFAPVGFGTVRLFKKPRSRDLRIVARVAADGPARRSADLLLLEGGLPVAELTGVRLAPVGRPAPTPFLHRPVWLRRSPARGAEQATRHVLVLGDRREWLTAAGERAAERGVRLSPVGSVQELPAALEDTSVTDVCWLWHADDTPMSAGRLRAECERNYRDLLALVAALSGGEQGRSPRLWLVTERGQWLPGDVPGTGEQLVAATLWGFGHVLLNEYPQHRATLVDTGRDTDPDVLFDEWLAQDTGEYQVAYRGVRRHVRRLLTGERTPAWQGGFEVRTGGDGADGEQYGQDDGASRQGGTRTDVAELVPVPAEDIAPAAGHVQVLVHAVGLTGRDLTEPGVPGTSCTGTVLAVGDGVARWAVGDRVVARHHGTLRRTVTVPSDAVSPAPGDICLTELAGAAGMADSDGPATPDVDVYGVDEVGEALEAVRRGTSGARVVVSLAPEPSASTATAGPRPTGSPAPVVRPDRTYLVSGGLGGLGLVTAEKLVDLGARHLVLVSRSGQPTPEAAELLAALSERAEVTLARADLGSAEDVARLTAGLRDAAVPVGGIVHAAGAAGKSLIGSLTWEAVDEQLRAQAYGGWLLHEASLDFPELDFFVVHSSIASVLGGATQAHYAAAFAFLDGLVAWRARSGLPALAVNWGAWGRVGMSARLEENLGRELRRSGVRFFSPVRALRTLERLLAGPAAQRVAGEFDWDRYVAPSMLDNALYSRLVRARTREDNGFDVNALLANPESERKLTIRRMVLEFLAVALHAEDEEHMDAGTEFVALGLDSLMALDLRTGLEKAFRIALPATLTFDHPTPQELAEFLDSRLMAAAPVTG
ncbi:SDR family NAD(P)-dependent oxidoreductase [Streptomyces sp. NPDC037389]|uniref:SDR family NAD(P)-dependent oxidoreductase n=1 Tax=Streptomyces sp. NPDC037389 TaxID=3155369 RepID=UPI003405DC81